MSRALLLTFLLCAADTDRPEELTLSSLTHFCRLQTRWVGVVQDLPRGLFLECDHVSVLIAHPNNFIGLVELRDSAAALEYVRLFSAAATAEYFSLDGMVEVRERTAAGETDFNFIPQQVFNRYCRRPRIRSLPAPSSDSNNGGIAGAMAFEIARTVVYPDGHIYEVHEIVSVRGYYKLSSRRLLLRNARQIGIIYPLDL